MSKKNVVLSVLLLTTFAAFVAAITALLLGHSLVFHVIRDVGVLSAIGAAYITIDIFHKEAEDLREERDDLHQFNHLLQQELRMAEEEIQRLRDRNAFLETSAKNGWEDAGEKWAQLLDAKNEVNDLKEKVKTLEAWIASPPATPEDIIW